MLSSACSNNSDKPKNDKYDKWKESLVDSLQKARNELDSANLQVITMRNNVDSILNKFTHVDNSKYVEGFTIFKGWENRYPLMSTGLVARMSNREELELIATLKGGNFTAIKVTANEKTVQSAIVPYDQALNYRENGLNTVAFTGNDALDIASLIDMTTDSNIIVTFINSNDTKTGLHTLSSDEKNMISATYKLVTWRKEIEHIEHQLPLLQEKVKIFEKNQP
jgi:hypothetical protein